MKRYLPHAYLFVALIVLWAWQRDTKRAGAAEERARVADSLLTIAEARADSLKVVYVRDTIRLTKWKTVYDTTRERLTLTDTVEVLRFIAVADSTIRSCTVALSTCELRVGAEKAVSAQWEAKWRAERARRPSFIGQASKLVIAGGIGWLAGAAGLP